ncbi:hypothetical protein F5051DRAFT_483120 [Lentinula edodes]|nr:hypothetical protein F5051DRAFT_483120 [Lentinula edodes]
MEHRITTLLNWCTTINIEIDERLQIVPDAAGLTVYSSATPIEPLQTLVKIPRTAVLSAKSCSASQFIESSPYGLEAQLALSLALLVEIERGTSSRWYGYLQSLPDTVVSLPVFWGLEFEEGTLEDIEDGKDALKWLKGTEVEKLLVGSDGTPLIDSLRKYFHEIVTPTMARLSSESLPSFHHFCRAYSLASSRAFLVDAYHGLSMVPIADAFNHTDEYHVHLETEYEVCPECGSLQQCLHDRDIEPTLGHPTSGFQQIEKDNTYDMVSNAAITPHSEVFNTYGETLSNAQLLTRYGFILDVNENDNVSWELESLIHFLEESKPSKSRGSCTPLELPWNTLVKSFDVDVFSNSELIFKPAEAAYCINCEGKVSWQFWLVVVFHQCASLVPAEEILSISMELGRYQTSREIQNLGVSVTIGATTRHNYLLPSLAQKTACMIRDLCQQRKTYLGDGRDQEGLGNLVDELDSSQSRTKLALLQVMTEISILNSLNYGGQSSTL